MSWKPIPGETPIDISGLKISGVTTIGATSVIREEYLAAIRTADSGNFSPLTALHRKYASKK